jgi:hypothetical protein
MYLALIWTEQRVPDYDMILIHDDDLEVIDGIFDDNVCRH